MKFQSIAKVSALAAAIAVSSSANATFFFDINGDTAVGGEITLDIFDWFPGNALFVDAAPIPASPAVRDFDLHLQGALNLAELAAGTEVTFQAVVPLRATIDVTGGTGTQFILDVIRPGGVFDIFYDDPGTLNTTGGVLSNDISGLGYGDGRHILHGDILASIAPETGGINVGPVSIGLLDQFGADNQAGTMTHGITGNAPTIRVEISGPLDGGLGFDDSFFPPDGNGDTIDVVGSHDLETSTDNLAAFGSSNPSDLVVGAVPDYGADGVNNNTCGGGAGVFCDIHAEQDARTPFLADLAVPEPSTIALLSLGLLGIGGAIGRRKS